MVVVVVGWDKGRAGMMSLTGKADWSWVFGELGIFFGISFGRPTCCVAPLTS